MNKNIQYLKYLDKAVEWEKGKYELLNKAHPPFNMAEILKIVEDYEFSKIQYTNDCVDRVKMIKALHNAYLRRVFLSIVRENFETINFENLKNNPRYLKIRDRILENHPEVNFVEDDKFLRQIANAFAHGNYNSLLDMQSLDEFVTASKNEKLTFQNKNKNIHLVSTIKDKEDLSENTKILLSQLEKVYNAPNKISELRLLLAMLGGTDNNSEIVEFKFESNFMLDGAGNVVRRPSPLNLDLKITHSELDHLLLMVIAERNLDNQIVLTAKQQDGKVLEIPKGSTDEDVAKMCLNNNDVCGYNTKEGSTFLLNLDEKQKQFFIDEYVHSRKWFNTEFFNFHDDEINDLLATNQPSHIMALGEFFYPTLLNLCYADMSLNDINSLFNMAMFNAQRHEQKNMQDVLVSTGYMVSGFGSVFNSYTESLTTEMLLLMQIVEEKGLMSECENSQEISNIIQSLDQTEMNKVRLSPKYRNDNRSVLSHMRDSFSHLIYLNSQNEKLYIYDYVSKRNRTPDFKFTITVDQLGQIKDEVLKIVCKNELAQANEDDLSHERS